jgi:hypothetical protein
MIAGECLFGRKNTANAAERYVPDTMTDNDARASVGVLAFRLLRWVRLETISHLGRGQDQNRHRVRRKVRRR